MDVSIKIREDGEISWLKSMYEQLKNKDSFNEDEIEKERKEEEKLLRESCLTEE